MRRHIGTAACWGIAAVAAIMMAGTALAGPPQATIGTPFNSTSGSYFSQTGVGFGFAIPGAMPNGGSGVVGLTPQGGFAPNIMFQQGGGANIPFGLGPTTPGAQLGYSVKTPLGTAFFNFTASQGSDRGMTSQSPSVTVMDGGTGFISDTSQSPFVTGIVPVVGNGGNSVLGERLQRLANGESATTQAELPRDPNAAPGTVANRKGPEKRDAKKAADAFDRRLAASQDHAAGGAVSSLAEIRAQQAAEDQAANELYRQRIQMAEAAIAGGKPGVARIYYQQVIRHANGALKQQAAAALKKLDTNARPPVGN